MDRYNIITARVSIPRFVARNIILLAFLQALSLLVVYWTKGPEEMEPGLIAKASAFPVVLITSSMWFFFTKTMEEYTVALGDTSVFGPSSMFGISGVTRIGHMKIDLTRSNIRSPSAVLYGGSIRAQILSLLGLP